jgi:hypothetical protein
MRIDDRTTVADFLVLGTWEALTLLGEARELCDADEVAELLSKAEQILIYRVHCPGRRAGQFAPTAAYRSAKRPPESNKPRLPSATEPRIADRKAHSGLSRDTEAAARSFLTTTACPPRSCRSTRGSSQGRGSSNALLPLWQRVF